VQDADDGDTATLQQTLPEAAEQLEAVAAVTDDGVAQIGPRSTARRTMIISADLVQAKMRATLKSGSVVAHERGTRDSSPLTERVQCRCRFSRAKPM
jgi:hypothetical protein